MWMEDYVLGVIEGKFADIIWQNEPIKSGELVKICTEELGWKKATTYNILKKLCLRGLLVSIAAMWWTGAIMVHCRSSWLHLQQ